MTEDRSLDEAHSLLIEKSMRLLDRLSDAERLASVRVLTIPHIWEVCDAPRRTQRKARAERPHTYFQSPTQRAYGRSASARPAGAIRVPLNLASTKSPMCAGP